MASDNFTFRPLNVISMDISSACLIYTWAVLAKRFDYALPIHFDFLPLVQYLSQPSSKHLPSLCGCRPISPW